MPREERFTYTKSDGVGFGLPKIERLCQKYNVSPDDPRPGFLALAQRHELSLPAREALIAAGILRREELPPWRD